MALHTDIELLVPAAENKCRELLDLCGSSSVLQRLQYRVMILETLRELAVQMAYAVKSRIRARPEDGIQDADWTRMFFRKAGLSWSPTDAENRLPSTWTLDSKHIDGKAFDLALTKDGTNPDWNAPDEAWQEVWKIARSLGLTCGADFKNKKDPGHFEIA